MTNEEKILSEIEFVKKELQILRTSISGDKLNKVTGLMDVVEGLHKEMYGDNDTQFTGLKGLQKLDRMDIQTMKERQTAAKWMVVGWSSGVSATMTAVGFWIKSFFTPK